MNKHFFTGTFLLGAIALVWVGAGFMGSNLLALGVTVVIAVVYGFGAWELRQFRRATLSLAEALAVIPEHLPSLGAWLSSVHPSLSNAVRLRIEGERIGLPGPALTPYLVGLLVMLGMLGTFLGMVVTLNGAVFALEGSTDLQAMRSAFSVPIKGLGLAFGTSVAGVASSAMLGLMSAISRRERLLAAQQLDTHIATTLRGFSLFHQRAEAFKAMQAQAQALPVVVDQLQAMMLQMDRMSLQLNNRLLSNQESFHSDVKGIYTQLAASVDVSLRTSLTQSAQVAADGIKPLIETTMNGLAREATHMHERMVSGLDTAVVAFAATLEQRAISLLTEVNRANLASQAEQAAGDRQRLDAWLGSMQAVTHTLTDTAQQVTQQAHSQGQAAVQRLGDLQTALTSHLTTLGTALEDPITRLIQTASEAPRAAAEVIDQLRQQMSRSVSRDNELLEERSRILETLNALLDSINHASVEQRAEIDALVASSAVALQQAGSQFSDNMGLEVAKLSDIAVHVTSSAVEVSSLSDAFSFAVNSFNDANEKLISSLQRIEGALGKSMVRSDEQLAYYVAQAREIIDLSTLSQKEIFEELRQLAGRQALLAEEAS